MKFNRLRGVTRTLTLILCIAAVTEVAAMEPFTSSSTGYDWKSASDAYRHSYCEMLADSLQQVKPGITGGLLYDSLFAFYNTDDGNLLKQKITQMVAMTVSASSESE